MNGGITGSVSHPITVHETCDPQEWEAFLPGAVNGTLFHMLRFLSYHPPERFRSRHLVFRRKGNLAAVFPAVEREEDGERVWVSHPGASYGGPAWSPKLRYHHLEEMVRVLVGYARENGFRRVRLTPPPVIYNRRPEQALDFALQRNNFRVVRSELTQAVALDFDPGRLLEQFVNRSRTALRKAEKGGLRFRIIEQPTGAELDEFWDILVENRAGLGVVPAHSRDEIARLHEILPDRLMMAVAEKDGRMAAVIWNFICNENTVLEFYMAHRADAQQLRPAVLLTYHTLLWARERGFRWLDFGISSIQGEPTWGLLRFKENFGARHFLRQTWEVEV